MEKKKTFFAIILSAFTILIGGLIWGILYAQNFFASWVTLIFGVASIISFLKIKNDGKVGMLIYIMLVSVVVNYFAMCLSASLVIKSVYSVTVSDVFASVLRSSFEGGFTDTLWCVIFTILGVTIGYFGGIIVNRKKRSEARKIENEMQEKYDSYVEELAIILLQFKNNKDKEFFTKRFTTYKREKMDVLTDSEIIYFKKFASNNIGEEYQDIARKLILKEILKREK